MNKPIYLISLRTKNSRELSTENSNNGKNDGKIEFTCTQEELQDVLIKLKDAVKQVERSSNINI